jgi:hypothetical protein
MASSPKDYNLADSAAQSPSETGNPSHFSDQTSAGETVCKRRSMERSYRDRLHALAEVVQELGHLASVDAICRRAVELGRSRLGFDRLSIWLIREDVRARMGMFGTDEEGRIRDERAVQRPFDPIYIANRHTARTFVEENEPLCDAHGFIVREGARATAEIWHWGRFIGFLYTDNLIQGKPITDEDREVLGLWAAQIGQLIVQGRRSDHD